MEKQNTATIHGAFYGFFSHINFRLNYKPYLRLGQLTKCDKINLIKKRLRR